MSGFGRRWMRRPIDRRLSVQRGCARTALTLVACGGGIKRDSQPPQHRQLPRQPGRCGDGGNVTGKVTFDGNAAGGAADQH